MLLEIKDLVKEYRNGVRANDGITLSVGEGEVFGLLGPNGAGKSTLVNQIIGLLGPTSGEIVIDGVDVVRDPGFGRKVCSYLPQGIVPIVGFTPLQAIELIGRLRGGEKNAVRKRTRELIEILQIEECSDGLDVFHLRIPLGTGSESTREPEVCLSHSLGDLS